MRRLHDHDENLDAIDGYVLRVPTDRIADSGAELTDENLWIDRSHTGDRAGLNANQEIAVSAYVLGSGGGLPVG